VFSFKKFFLYSIVAGLIVLLILFIIFKNTYQSQRFECVKKDLDFIALSLDTTIKQVTNSMFNIFNSDDTVHALEEYISGKLYVEGLKRFLGLKVTDNPLIYSSLIGMILEFKNKIVFEMGETLSVKNYLQKFNESDSTDIELFKDRDRIFINFYLPVKGVKGKVASLFDISDVLNKTLNHVYTYYISFEFCNKKPRGSKYSYVKYLPSVSKYINFEISKAFLSEGFSKHFFALLILFFLVFINITAYMTSSKFLKINENSSKSMKNCGDIIKQLNNLQERFNLLNKLIVDIVSDEINWNVFCKDLTIYLGGIGAFIAFVNNNNLEILGSYVVASNSPMNVSRIFLGMSPKYDSISKDKTTTLVDLKKDPNSKMIAERFGIPENSILNVSSILLNETLIGFVVVVYDDLKKIKKEAEEFLYNLTQLIDEKIKSILDLKEPNRKVDDTLKNIDKELLKMAMFDRLTGIPNRRYLELKLRTFLSNYKTLGKKFGVIFFDIDNFKKFNDTYGHNCGDVALRTVGKVLKKVLRSKDVFGRWGGEEFMAIIDDADEKALYSSAERIRKAVEKTPVECANKILRATVSIGTTVVRENDTVDSIVKRADDLMYQSKQKGKNTVTIG